LRIFEACGADIEHLGEEHGHRVLRVCGKGGQVVLIPLPPAVSCVIDRAVDGRDTGPILGNTLGARMDRNAATRRLKHLATAAGIRMPRMHPHMLRHTFVTTMLDAGVSLRDVQIAARHADPRTTMRYDRARTNLDRPPTTSSPPTWHPAPDQPMRDFGDVRASKGMAGGGASPGAGVVGVTGGSRAGGYPPRRVTPSDSV
jgi:integrase